MFSIEVISKIKNYPVIIGNDSLNNLKTIVSGSDKILIVSDENVNHYHGNILNKFLKGKTLFKYILKASERSKSLKSLTNILDILKMNNFTRDSFIIAFGGGVVGDIAGFAASVYMRGINLIQIPTTLLSCVDSSIGGKTGIDYKGIKNLIGSFYNPSAVIIEPSFLKTLPPEELISGVGEIIKYKFLIGGEFFKKEIDFINNKSELNSEEITSIIKECVNFKISVISNDERDRGLRKILNLGHTFGHAYESSSGYKIKHGKAVALGIITSLYLSYSHNIINKDQLSNYINIPMAILPGINKMIVQFNEVMDAIKLDKKSSGGIANFVLINSPGNIITDFKSDNKKISSAIKSTFMV